MASGDAQILILGSMPGRASLNAVEYYAHPRNVFWSIMAALLNFDINQRYALRCGALKSSGVALWDVLRSCRRAGSLDTAIDPTSAEANDFSVFLQRQRKLRALFFNGAAAEALYRRHVLPGLGPSTFKYARLPSTSPAHAALTFEEKLRAWRAALLPHLRR